MFLRFLHKLTILRNKRLKCCFYALLVGFFIVFLYLAGLLEKEQDDKTTDDVASYIAEYAEIRYRILWNNEVLGNEHEVIIRNTGPRPIPPDGWSIYFNHLHRVDALGSYDLTEWILEVPAQFQLKHVYGRLSKLTPTFFLLDISPNDHVTIRLSNVLLLSRFQLFPRWYVVGKDGIGHVIKSTANESLSFAEGFYPVGKYRREIGSHLFGFKPEERYEKYFIPGAWKSPFEILPTPLHSYLMVDEFADLKKGSWVICKPPTLFMEEVERFAKKFEMGKIVQTCSLDHVIRFVIDLELKSDEAYQIKINKKFIEISARKPAGAFYAVQTLMSLAETNDGRLHYQFPTGIINDSPRFQYRGLMVDVARNFLKPDDLINLIETMSLYKLNKLHLHLTDDEGWRIEIEGLPELTQIAAFRKHGDSEAEAIFPSLGSGPTSKSSGSGFYTASDYKRILEAAAANHIQVIPEVDFPGHSHAAIRAMEARYNRLMKEGKKEEASEFLLNDGNDKTEAVSPQLYTGNSVNPCMESTYRFIDRVIFSLKKMHEEVQPLQIMHVGGDEVPRKSWSESPLCGSFLEKTKEFPKRTEDLKEYFMRRVSGICWKKHGVSVGMWEDGAFRSSHEEPFEHSELSGAEVVTYPWSNTPWENDRAGNAYRLANAGYKVVMSHGTHLYLDHPHEPDPEERGLTWATRYIDDQRVFGFLPDDLYGNANYDWGGAPIAAVDKEYIRNKQPPLNEDSHNVIGMQAALWTEIVRDVTALHSQLFPRLIAFAERAWHKAEWESISDGPKMRSSRRVAWTRFAKIVGYKELPRLKRRGIKYRIPPPGVKFKNGKLKINSLYPGFKYYCRKIFRKQSSDWSECLSGDPISDPENTCYQFKTSDGSRESRIISSLDKCRFPS